MRHGAANSTEQNMTDESFNPEQAQIFADKINELNCGHTAEISCAGPNFAWINVTHVAAWEPMKNGGRVTTGTSLFNEEQVNKWIAENGI